MKKNSATIPRYRVEIHYAPCHSNEISQVSLNKYSITPLGRFQRKYGESDATAHQLRCKSTHYFLNSIIFLPKNDGKGKNLTYLCSRALRRTLHRLSRRQDNKTFRHQDIQTFRHLDIQTFRHQDVKTTRHQDNKTTKHQNIQIMREQRFAATMQ